MRKKKLILEDWFLEELIPRFNNRIIPVDIEVIIEWSKLSGESKKKGIVIPIVDGIIAATAIAKSLTVVTENVDDFIHTGARVFNPWLDND